MKKINDDAKKMALEIELHDIISLLREQSIILQEASLRHEQLRDNYYSVLEKLAQLNRSKDV
jgi:hypothetical protein